MPTRKDNEAVPVDASLEELGNAGGCLRFKARTRATQKQLFFRGKLSEHFESAVISLDSAAGARAIRYF